MIVVRDLFQAHYGQGDELVALFKTFRDELFSDRPLRILVDASGPFFTVVTEYEVESLAEWERLAEEGMTRQDFADWFAQMVPLVQSGRREFYRLVS